MWHPLEDHVMYACSSEHVSSNTNRSISNVSNPLDPIGLIFPGVVVAIVIVHFDVLRTHLYDEASLQVFCDASEKSYGARVYLVSVKADQHFDF